MQRTQAIVDLIDIPSKSMDGVIFRKESLPDMTKRINSIISVITMHSDLSICFHPEHTRKKLPCYHLMFIRFHLFYTDNNTIRNK